VGELAVNVVGTGGALVGVLLVVSGLVGLVAIGGTFGLDAGDRRRLVVEDVEGADSVAEVAGVVLDGVGADVGAERRTILS